MRSASAIAGATVSWSGGSALSDASGNYTLSNVTVKRWSKYYDFDATRPKSFDVKEVDESATEAADLTPVIEHFLNEEMSHE